jgi:hypothetical protein
MDSLYFTDNPQINQKQRTKTIAISILALLGILGTILLFSRTTQSSLLSQFSLEE